MNDPKPNTHWKCARCGRRYDLVVGDARAFMERHPRCPHDDQPLVMLVAEAP